MLTSPGCLTSFGLRTTAASAASSRPATRRHGQALENPGPIPHSPCIRAILHLTEHLHLSPLLLTCSSSPAAAAAQHQQQQQPSSSSSSSSSSSPAAAAAQQQQQPSSSPAAAAAQQQQQQQPSSSSSSPAAAAAAQQQQQPSSMRALPHHPAAACPAALFMSLCFQLARAAVAAYPFFPDAMALAIELGHNQLAS
ncbi:hypothetical protein QJQ45_003544 [Haematococcus lacustris]|nr:hypothetical protein QJQ45_003544 [Haematococcus lacustris]